MKSLSLLKKAASEFLSVADANSEFVSNYLNGDDSRQAFEAYENVKQAESYFLSLYNDFYSESVKPSLNYDLAEYFI